MYPQTNTATSQEEMMKRAANSEGQVFNACHRLEKEVELNGGLLEALEIRLQGILRPIGPDGERGAVAKEALVPVATLIDDQVERMSRRNSQLKSILDRIEL